MRFGIRRLTINSAQRFTRNFSSNPKHVLFEEINGNGVITLNRPDKHNALDDEMVQRITDNLEQWKSTMKMILLKGAGEKAFCSGGDIARIGNAALRRDPIIRDYYASFYRLCGLIGTYPIPIVALIDGITMGGGAGISVLGTYRIGTQRTIFGMPETKIGFFPDGGASYFLPRLFPSEMGLYLGLSGAKLKGSEVYSTGIATHMCKAEEIQNLEAELIRSPNLEDMEKVLQSFTTMFMDSGQFSSSIETDKIVDVFNVENVEEIFDNLRKLNCNWSQSLLKTLNNISPSALKVSFNLQRIGKSTDLLTVLRTEYTVACRSCENGDFVEGVRSLLNDKTTKPKWKPETLDQVTPELVQSYFTPLLPEDELKFHNEENQLDSINKFIQS